MAPRISLIVSVGSISLLLAGGCTSESSRRGPAGPHPAELVVALQGEAQFFANTLRADATVSQVHALRNRGGGEGGHAGRSSGGYGGRRRGREETSLDAGGSDEAPPAELPRVVGPSLTLRVKFTNLSTQPLDLQIRDISSELGSFAVRPERLLLAPGQTSEVDPMVSQLGVAAAEIPVTIVLQAGTRTETQVLPVKAIPPGTARQP